MVLSACVNPGGPPLCSTWLQGKPQPFYQRVLHPHLACFPAFYSNGAGIKHTQSQTLEKQPLPIWPPQLFMMRNQPPNSINYQSPPPLWIVKGRKQVVKTAPPTRVRRSPHRLQRFAPRTPRTGASAASTQGCSRSPPPHPPPQHTAEENIKQGGRISSISG